MQIINIVIHDHWSSKFYSKWWMSVGVNIWTLSQLMPLLLLLAMLYLCAVLSDPWPSKSKCDNTQKLKGSTTSHFHVQISNLESLFKANHTYGSAKAWLFFNWNPLFSHAFRCFDMCTWSNLQLRRSPLLLFCLLILGVSSMSLWVNHSVDYGVGETNFLWWEMMKPGIHFSTGERVYLFDCVLHNRYDASASTAGIWISIVDSLSITKMWIVAKSVIVGCSCFDSLCFALLYVYF